MEIRIIIFMSFSGTHLNCSWNPLTLKMQHQNDLCPLFIVFMLGRLNWKEKVGQTLYAYYNGKWYELRVVSMRRNNNALESGRDGLRTDRGFRGADCSCKDATENDQRSQSNGRRLRNKARRNRPKSRPTASAPEGLTRTVIGTWEMIRNRIGSRKQVSGIVEDRLEFYTVETTKWGNASTARGIIKTYHIWQSEEAMWKRTIKEKNGLGRASEPSNFFLSCRYGIFNIIIKFLR